jgi:hypothetical protein
MEPAGLDLGARMRSGLTTVPLQSRPNASPFWIMLLLSLAVRAENLDSAISVMKAAENRSRCDGAEPLNRPMNGSILAQSPMSS